MNFVRCYTPRGEVAERLNALDSKSSLGQLNGGSNPPLSVLPPGLVDKPEIALDVDIGGVCNDAN